MEKRGKISAKQLFREISAGKTILNKKEYIKRISEVSIDRNEIEILKKGSDLTNNLI